MVIDHPLAGDEVPEDVRITAAPYEHAEDHDERGDHQKLPGRDASEATAQGCGHHAEGYSVPRPSATAGLGCHKSARSRCFT